ncbi:unnamed protein product [Rhizoctonia solani]|uniref:Uncharacterized protein n=1 Tax=Rhizoctonia solani TaxID=456999 RepID=A0A8H2XG06_9AGAM|nr:unnamed protein product [Rhizoctonia solani]
MPPRSKRKGSAAPARVTRSKARAPDEQATTATGKSIINGANSGPGPSTRGTRSHLIVEVVLPASKRPTPKTSSALSSVSPTPSNAVPDAPDQPSPAPIQIPQPIGESTPQVLGKESKRKAAVDSLPPSSPPPMSSPAQELKWDHLSDPVFSTPTPSPTRSRRHSKEASVQRPTRAETTALTPLPPVHISSPHQSSPSADIHPELEVAHSDGSQSFKEGKTNEHKPPTSPAPYSDTLAADDPFGFLAAESRLRERRIEMGIEGVGSDLHMPSSGGPQSFDQSACEEAFASIFYDPQSGTATAPSEAEPHRRSARTSTEASLYDTDEKGDDPTKARLKRKQTMEVVIPTKGKGKEKSKQRTAAEAIPKHSPPKPKLSRRAQRGQEKAKERTLTTYELEAMLPHRIKRTRKPQAKDEESIALSDIDSDEPSSPPKKSRVASAAKKNGQNIIKTATKGSGTSRSRPLKTDKATNRPPKRARGGETTDMGDETRKRFEAERKRRLEAYKALDTYTLEEEEVVW